MAYFVGAIFPFLLLLLGVVLVVVGIVHEPGRDGLVIAGAILLVGVLLCFSIADDHSGTGADDRGRNRSSD